MSPIAQLIICEKKGFWAAALRWQPGSLTLPTQETRSLIDTRSALQAAPASLLALETTLANAEGVLRLLHESRQAWPMSRVVVLLTSEVGALRDLFWESGAALVVSSPRRLDLVRHFIERNLAIHEPPEQLTRDWVWSRLPWTAEQA